jgi:hypothetical protein
VATAKAYKFNGEVLSLPEFWLKCKRGYSFLIASFEKLLGDSIFMKIPYGIVLVAKIHFLLLFYKQKI